MSTYRQITIDTIPKEIHLTWHDLRWAMERKIIAPKFAIAWAERRLRDGTVDDLELELTWCLDANTNRISALVDDLQRNEAEWSEEDSKQKWLFILLYDLYRHRADYEDPLAVVEEIFADFDYPPEMYKFVKYMPPSDDYDPRQHSRSENLGHLLKAWENYIERKAVHFGLKEHQKLYP